MNDGLPKCFKFHPSRILTALLFSLYFFVIIIVSILPMPLVYKLVGIGFLSLAIFIKIRDDVWFMSACSCVAMRIEESGIVLISRDGKEAMGTILRSSFVTPLVTILNVKLQNQARQSSVILLADSMDVANFRELRVLLKWSKLEV